MCYTNTLMSRDPQARLVGAFRLPRPVNCRYDWHTNHYAEKLKVKVLLTAGSMRKRRYEEEPTDMLIVIHAHAHSVQVCCL